MEKISERKFNKPVKEAVKGYISMEEFSKRFTPEENAWADEQAAYFSKKLALAKTRKEKRLTQQELSDLTYIPRSAISSIESGKRNVTIATLERIAKALGKKLVIEFR